MKFTLERKALVKMLQHVGKKAPSQTWRDKHVRLSACAARVFLEANQMTAGTEALVFEDGTCLLELNLFLNILKTYERKANITIEAGGNTLKFFSTTLPITDYSSTVSPPDKFQIFPVTDLSVLGPGAAPAPEPEPHPQPPVVPSNPGTFPITEDEMHLVQEAIRLTRRVCGLPSVSPVQLAGLAHALFALERLPLVTSGADIEFALGIRWGTANDHSDASVTVHICDTWLEFGTLCINCDPVTGSDSSTTTVYAVASSGYRSMAEGDEDAWTGIFDWINQFQGYLDENSPEELLIFVADKSTPGFMKERKEQ